MSRGAARQRRQVHTHLERDQIETRRLRLRTFRVDDWGALLEIMCLPETFRFSERGPMTGDEVWSRLLRHVGHWVLLGHGMFAVEEKESGRLVGEAGLGDFRRGLGPSFDGFPEAGWTIAPWAWGRGYASEAAGAAHQWLDEQYGAQRSVCVIHVENVASLKVAVKLGYHAFAKDVYRGYPALFHERVVGVARG